MTIPLRFTKRQQLIDALESQRPEAQRRDAEATAAHKAKEKEALAAYRARCREQAKKSYAEIVAQDEASGSKYHPPSTVALGRPECPILLESKLDAAIARLQVTHQESFTITRRDWSGMYDLLTLSVPVEGTAC